MTDLTYALWGRGVLTEENAKALLEEYIPDNVGAVYRPDVVDREHQGLRNALDWFESPDFLGENGAFPTTDILASLIYEREGPWDTDREGDEVFLLALWPEDPTHEEFDFIESVQAAGITVFDLSRALDELDLSLYSRPDPTKEEKAAAKAAEAEVKRGRGRPKGSGSKKLSDNAETGEASEGIKTYPTVSPAPEVDEAPSVATVPDLNELLKNTTADLLIAAIDTYIEAKVVEILARRATNPAAEVDLESGINKNDKDRPPFDGPYVDPNSRAFFYNKNTDSYRPASGKPRRGEEVVNLSQDRIAELGLETPF